MLESEIKDNSQEKEDSKQIKASLLQTTINIAKVINGYGTFAQSNSFFYAGILSGVAYFFLVAVMMVLSAEVLGKCEDYLRSKRKVTEKLSYATLIRHMLGPLFEVVVHASIVLTIFFGVSLYCKIISDNIGKLISSEKWVQVLVLFLVFLFVFGLTYLETPVLMAVGNLFGMVAIFGSVALVVLMGFFAKENSTSTLNWFPRKKQAVISGACDAIFLLSLHLVTVDFRQSIQRPRQNYFSALMLGTGISTLFNLVFTWLSAYLFAEQFLNPNIKSEFVLNCLVKSNKIMTSIVKIGFSISLSFSAMVLSGVAFKHLREIMQKFMSEEESLLVDILKRATFFLLGAFSALGLELGLFMDILGAICFPCISLIFPSILLFQLTREDETNKNSVPNYLLGAFYLLVGVFLILYGVLKLLKVIT